MRQGESPGGPRGPGTQDEDAPLVRAVARGDQAALAALYDRHAPLLLAVGRRILGAPREAEDLLHDVFLEAWRAAGDYDPARGSVRAWLVMRMRSRALDRVRAAGRAKVVLGASDAQPEVAGEPQDLGRGVDRARVLVALERLSPEHREILELGYFEGLSSSEIAARLSVPIGTVKSRVARGLAQLRAGFMEPAARGGER